MNPIDVQVSWFFAFLAGLVSFLSPCVLPLIPGYISMVSKTSFEELSKGNTEGKVSRIVIPSILFVLGFALVFVALGASASLIGAILQQNKSLLLRISGVIIILFGLFSMDILKIPLLSRERRFLSVQVGSLGLIGTFLLGVAFGFGWTPCVGPILASILLVASTAEGAGRGAALLLVYSIGLGLPFIITGLILSKALTAFDWIKRNYGIYKVMVGGTLLVIGILMLTHNLFYLNVLGQKALDFMGIDFWKSF